MLTSEKIAGLPPDLRPYVTAHQEKPGMGDFVDYLHRLFGPERPTRVDTLSAAAPVGPLETELSSAELLASTGRVVRPELAQGLQAVRGWLRRVPNLVREGRHIVTPRLERTLSDPQARRQQFDYLSGLAMHGRVRLYDGTLPVVFHDTNAIFMTDKDGGTAVYSEALTYRPDDAGTLRVDPTVTSRRFYQPGTIYARDMYDQFSNVADMAIPSVDTAAYYRQLSRAEQG